MNAPLRSMLLIVGALSLTGVVMKSAAAHPSVSTLAAEVDKGGKDGGSIDLADKGKDGGSVDLADKKAKEGGAIDLAGKDGGSVDLAEKAKEGGSIELASKDDAGK